MNRSFGVYENNSIWPFNKFGLSETKSERERGLWAVVALQIISVYEVDGIFSI